MTKEELKVAAEIIVSVRCERKRNNQKNWWRLKKMDETQVYEAIFKRKSIRDYDPTPLDSNRLEEITESLQTLKPLLGR